MSENATRTIDLEDTFSLHGHSSKQYILKLSPTVLSISLQSAHQNTAQATSDDHLELIPIDEIYGCLCMKSYQSPIQCHLSLYLYTQRKPKGISGTFSKKESLYRSQRIFTYGKFDDYESNFAEMTRWYRAVTRAIYLRRNLPRN
jgi:hypothetical protein